MRNVLVAVLLGLAGHAQALPYFRFVDPAHLNTNIGACVDPVNVGHSQQCTMLAVITHSHNDGHLIFKGEDWSLLSIGYSASGEGAAVAIGPSLNIMPAAGEAMAWVLNTMAPNSKVANDLATFASQKDGRIKGSFGPTFVFDPFAADGKGKGYFRLFAGASWNF